MKCGIIFIGVVIVIDLIFNALELATVMTNEYFDVYYGIVFLIFVVILLVAVGLMSYYWIAADSKDSRAVVPWGFLLAAIANLLIFIWVLVYILALYKKDKVYVPKTIDWGGSSESAADDPDEDPKKSSNYYKMTKGNYLLGHVITPFFNAILFFVFWWTARGWVERHAN